MEFIHWLFADDKNFAGMMLFIGATCYFLTWPIEAWRKGAKHD